MKTENEIVEGLLKEYINAIAIESIKHRDLESEALKGYKDIEAGKYHGAICDGLHKAHTLLKHYFPTVVADYNKEAKQMLNQ